MSRRGMKQSIARHCVPGQGNQKLAGHDMFALRVRCRTLDQLDKEVK